LFIYFYLKKGTNDITSTTTGLNNALSSTNAQQQARLKLQQQQQQQLQSQLVSKTQQAQTATQAAVAEIKREGIKPETVNKTSITQTKSLNAETIKIESKNLKASSSDVFEGMSKI